jgi:hypothetical protein
MSAMPTGPQPLSTAQILRDRSRDLHNQRNSAIYLACGLFVLGVGTAGFTWQYVGWEIAVFSLFGCAFIVASIVMVVAIIALSGHRASNDAQLRVVEKVDRFALRIDTLQRVFEQHIGGLAARADTRQREFDEQIETITELIARLSETVKRIAQNGIDPGDLSRRRSLHSHDS